MMRLVNPESQCLYNISDNSQGTCKEYKLSMIWMHELRRTEQDKNPISEVEYIQRMISHFHLLKK